jgi:hypothetical protein
MSVPPVLSLHRYFIACNRMRFHLDEMLGEYKPEMDRSAPEVVRMYTYLNYWYGGLYIVIEGWRKLQLTDPVIDELLTSPNVELLRRYRNGAFHFQKDYFDDRFEAFTDKGMEAIEWVRSLHRGFSRFFLKWLAEDGADDESVES